MGLPPFSFGFYAHSQATFPPFEVWSLLPAHRHSCSDLQKKVCVDALRVKLLAALDTRDYRGRAASGGTAMGSPHILFLGLPSAGSAGRSTQGVCHPLFAGHSLNVLITFGLTCGRRSMLRGSHGFMRWFRGLAWRFVRKYWGSECHIGGFVPKCSFRLTVANSFGV